MLAPVFEGVSTKMREKAKFFKVDIDENGYIAQKYRISAVPTMIIFMCVNLEIKLFRFNKRNLLSDFMPKTLFQPNCSILSINPDLSKIIDSFCKSTKLFRG